MKKITIVQALDHPWFVPLAVAVDADRVFFHLGEVLALDPDEPSSDPYMLQHRLFQLNEIQVLVYLPGGPEWIELSPTNWRRVVDQPLPALFKTAQRWDAPLLIIYPQVSETASEYAKALTEAIARGRESYYRVHAAAVAYQPGREPDSPIGRQILDLTDNGWFGSHVLWVP